jgi:DNA-binding MarR family transcriptional regulator
VHTDAAIDDRRRLLVRLTASARRLVAALIPVEEACTGQTLSTLSDAEQGRLVALLRKQLDE